MKNRKKMTWPILNPLIFLLVFTSCSKEDDYPPKELYGSWDLIEKIHLNPDGSVNYSSYDGKGGTLWIIDEEGISYETMFGSSGIGITTGEAYKYHNGELNLFLSGRHKIINVDSNTLHLRKLDSEMGHTEIHFEKLDAE